MSDQEKLESIARELCRAAGKNPDAKMRLGTPMSFAAGECTVIKPLIVPAWKTYCREARRLAMSNAEHAEVSEQDHGPCGHNLVLRVGRRSARRLRIKLYRRWRRLHIAPRLRALCATIDAGASMRAREGRAYSY